MLKCRSHCADPAAAAPCSPPSSPHRGSPSAAPDAGVRRPLDPAPPRRPVAVPLRRAAEQRRFDGRRCHWGETTAMKPSPNHPSVPSVDGRRRRSAESARTVRRWVKLIVGNVHLGVHFFHTGVRRRKYKLGQTKQQPPGGQHIAKHCSFMCLQKTPKCAVRMVRTLSSACRLQHWDPGSPSSRVPAFLLARSKINLLRLADASGARG